MTCARDTQKGGGSDDRKDTCATTNWVRVRGNEQGAAGASRPPQASDPGSTPEHTSGDAEESRVQPPEDPGPTDKRDGDKRDFDTGLTPRQRARMADLSLLLDVFLKTSSTRWLSIPLLELFQCLDLVLPQCCSFYFFLIFVVSISSSIL